MLALVLLGLGSAEARPRVAFLTLGDQQMDGVYVAAFVEGLRRLGYVEGRNVDIDYRYTAGNVERLKPLAQELVALHPDVLVGSEPSAARALKDVAPASPIVWARRSSAGSTFSNALTGKSDRQAGGGGDGRHPCHRSDRLPLESNGGVHGVLCPKG
jgi:ABC-type uncharacterized transport system substrate-binding protein